MVLVLGLCLVALLCRELILGLVCNLRILKLSSTLIFLMWVRLYRDFSGMYLCLYCKGARKLFYVEPPISFSFYDFYSRFS